MSTHVRSSISHMGKNRGGGNLVWKNFLVTPQELEVRSLNRPYSLKTKSSQCHYIVDIRTELQAPVVILNCF